MAEIRTAHSPRAETIIRLTLFPPSGKRIIQRIKNHRHSERGVLAYTDQNGIECETSLPFAIEEIPEGYKEAPFLER